MTYFKRLQVTDNETGKVVSEWEAPADKAEIAQQALQRQIDALGLNLTVKIGDLS